MKIEIDVEDSVAAGLLVLGARHQLPLNQLVERVLIAGIEALAQPAKPARKKRGPNKPKAGPRSVADVAASKFARGEPGL